MVDMFGAIDGDRRLGQTESGRISAGEFAGERGGGTETGSLGGQYRHW